MYEDQIFLAKLYLSVPVYFADRVWLDYRQHDNSCVARETRDGRYHKFRRDFLEWLQRIFKLGRHTSATLCSRCLIGHCSNIAIGSITPQSNRFGVCRDRDANSRLMTARNRAERNWSETLIPAGHAKLTSIGVLKRLGKCVVPLEAVRQTRSLLVDSRLENAREDHLKGDTQLLPVRQVCDTLSGI